MYFVGEEAIADTDITQVRDKSNFAFKTCKNRLKYQVKSGNILQENHQLAYSQAQTSS